MRVLAVPQRHGEAQPALAIGNAEQPILAPSISSRVRMLVGEALPQSAIRRIVFTDRRPLPLAQIRTPAFPILHAPTVFVEPQSFPAHHEFLRLCARMTEPV